MDIRSKMMSINSAVRWLNIAELVILLAYMCPSVSGSALCLQCDRLPHPRDCDRVVQCNTHEICYVEQIVTVSGNVVYNSGCASDMKCNSAATKRNSVSYSRNINEQRESFDSKTDRDNNSVDEVSVYETAEDDLVTCFKCCNSSRYCNRDLCDYGAPVPHPNQTFCLSCSNVVNPSDCEYLVLCNPGEICYTEFISLNGEDRYRLGCISNTACTKTPVSNSGPALVGKKRFVMNGFTMANYCSKCCSDGAGNCNRELCGTSGSIPPGIDVLELVNPPERKDFCTDLYPDSCKILIIQDPALCKDPRYSHYACREYCGTCINPGHVTSAPTHPSSTGDNGGTSLVVTPTRTTTPAVPATDCFYESTRYMGAYTYTISGTTCVNWAELDPNINGIPDASVTAAGNQCRDPDGRGFPWCFTSTNSDWDFCPVPYCQECFYPNLSGQYSGYVSKDVDNTTCLPWSDYFKKTGISSSNATYVAALKNYCRDPEDYGIPQCYTGGAALKNCDVPMCAHECQDDSDTNCALVKPYLCKYEYPSVTLCPKTCDACKFGLRPPRKIDSPKDKCVDNPDASCDILQSIICGDPDGAVKLCPKTCGKCNIVYGKTTSAPFTSPSTTSTTIRTTLLTTQSTSSTTMLQTTPLLTNPSTTTAPSTPPTTTTVTTPTTPTTTPTTTPAPYWLSWEEWKCATQQGACFQRRFRNCSTGLDKNCIDIIGGVRYGIDVCTPAACPDYFTTTTSKTTPITTPLDACHDDPSAIGCNDNTTLTEVCKENQIAWTLCRASCNLCDTCWDYLDCSTSGAQKLFCGREEYALQYCRKTCGKCNHKPVDVQINKCGDPVANELICELLQNELCICNDPDVRVLCEHYCDNRCKDHPFAGSTCTPARRKRRDATLQRLGFL